jgi:hypothetical protein
MSAAVGLLPAICHGRKADGAEALGLCCSSSRPVGKISSRSALWHIVSPM